MPLDGAVGAFRKSGVSRIGALLLTEQALAVVTPHGFERRGITRRLSQFAFRLANQALVEFPMRKHRVAAWAVSVAHGSAFGVMRLGEHGSNDRSAVRAAPAAFAYHIPAMGQIHGPHPFAAFTDPRFGARRITSFFSRHFTCPGFVGHYFQHLVVRDHSVFSRAAEIGRYADSSKIQC